MTTLRSIARASARRNSPHHSTKAWNPRKAQGRVYVASPITTYGTTRYGAMLDRLHELWPEAEMIPARNLFASNADWRRRWSNALPTLDAVVFFDDGEGWIGRGVLEEITTAQRSGIPVFYLADGWPLAEPRLFPCDERGTVKLTHNPASWVKAARIEYALPASEAVAMMKGGG